MFFLLIDDDDQQKVKNFQNHPSAQMQSTFRRKKEDPYITLMKTTAL